LAPTGNQIAPGAYVSAIQASAPAGQQSQQTLTVPNGNTLYISTLSIQNVTVAAPGSIAEVGIEPSGSTTPNYLFDLSLSSTSASETFNLTTPLVLSQGDTLVMTVTCATSDTGASTSCGANTSLVGTAQLGDDGGPPSASNPTGNGSTGSS